MRISSVPASAPVSDEEDSNENQNLSRPCRPNSKPAVSFFGKYMPPPKKISIKQFSERRNCSLCQY